jgi:DNA-binding transcriptional ArsR family regulator
MDADIATIAALIGDPTRAKILLALMGGLALPAGELAMCANIAPQTASSHLFKLLEAKLLNLEVQGRHRYYRLAGPEIGSILESLMTVAPTPKLLAQRESEPNTPLRFARTCYNHLAGAVAVQISQAFQEHGLLVAGSDKQYGVTADGRLWFERFGIILDEIKSSRSGFLLVSVWIGSNGRCLWALRARDLLTATGFWLYQAPGHGASIEQPAPNR